MHGLNRLIPLGRQYHPLLAALNPRTGLLAVPFGPHLLLQPAAWRKQVASIFLTGADIIPEFASLAPLCRELRHGTLVDLGANVGLYTLSLRSVSNLPIIAYEPQPFLFQLLSWTVAFNHLPDVQTRNIACGSEKGVVPFAIGANGAVLRDTLPASERGLAGVPSSAGWDAEAERLLSGGRLEVPMTTLDEDLANVARIALLKIDCEGYEHHILQGARETLARHRPLLFLELHGVQLKEFGRSVEQVVELLSPIYAMEFWCFKHARHRTKLGRSLAKFRRPRQHRFASAEEMFVAANAPDPGHIYCIGRPK